MSMVMSQMSMADHRISSLIIIHSGDIFTGRGRGRGWEGEMSKERFSKLKVVSSSPTQDQNSVA